MPIETIRISKSGRDQLLTLKRRTKIGTWNVLCRWAFCVSMAEKSIPHALSGETEAAIEISLGTLFGAHAGLYMALLRMRCRQDGLDPSDDTLSMQLHLHIHRGISYLAGSREIPSIRELCGLALVDGVDDDESPSRGMVRQAVG